MASTRQWLQFSIRGVLVAATVLCLWLGVQVNRASRQRAAVEHILGLGGSVTYHHMYDSSGKYIPNAAGPGPEWLRGLIGDEYFDSVKEVTLRDTELADDTMQRLSSLPQLTAIILDKSNVTDQGLSYLAHLERLESLHLKSTSITDAGLRHLGQLSSLNELWLDGTGVTDASLPVLISLPSLKQVRLVGTEITESGVAQLIEHGAVVHCFLDPKVAVYDASGHTVTKVTGEQLRIHGTCRAPAGSVLQTTGVLVRLRGLQPYDDRVSRITYQSGRPEFIDRGNGDFEFTVTLDSSTLKADAIPGLVTVRYGAVYLCDLSLTAD